MPGLTLTIDDFSVTFTKFTQNGYDRSTLEAGDQEYSLVGVPLVDGILYEPKLIWTIEAFASRTDLDQLYFIWRRSERKRSNQQDFAITVEDHVRELQEDASSPSRAVASGGSVTVTGGGCSYPATFEARLYSPKDVFVRNGQWPYTASFILRELEVVPA